jgi:hypothetical protein
LRKSCVSKKIKSKENEKEKSNPQIFFFVFFSEQNIGRGFKSVVPLLSSQKNINANSITCNNLDASHKEKFD